MNPPSPRASLVELDHIAHFVPEREACLRSLLELGFAPTPFSLQYNRPGPDQALTAAGTGNHCVMLNQGYLEFLAPTADTGVAAQLRSAMTRYVGAHSIVFGTGDAAAEYRRLQTAGFNPAPPIALERPIDTGTGADTARFTVVRVPPGTMAEGRIQYCQHHTPRLVWQKRWLQHPNGAAALRAALVCVEDLDEAAERYARFTGVRFASSRGRRVFAMQRGRVELFDPATFRACFGVAVGTVPWIAGCELLCHDLDSTREALARHGVQMRQSEARGIVVSAPATVGGIVVFTAA